MPDNKSFTTQLYPYIFIALMLISLWIVSFDVVEYLFTEYWYVWNEIGGNTRTWALLGLIFAGAFLPIRKVTQKQMGVMVAVLLLTLTAHSAYRNYYDDLQKFPKVKSISRDWSIQGDRITITGRNFGGEWQLGGIVVGELEFNIISWNQNRVVAEQPVPDSFFSAPLMIINHYGNQTIVVEDFEIKNPSDVL
jgi:hypothetical protein